MTADFAFDLVGFDLDGTLLDTHGDLAQAVNHALAAADRAPIAPAQVHHLVGGGAWALLGRALALTGGPVSDAEMDRLHTALIDHYTAHIADCTRLFPGGGAMLDALAARGVKLAVATNKREALARRLLDALGLTEYFATIIGGDTLGLDATGNSRAKPAPDILFEMITRTAADPARTVFIGDSSYDSRAARAAGVPFVVASFGYPDLPLAEIGADAAIAHFDELIPTLARLGAQG